MSAFVFTTGFAVALAASSRAQDATPSEAPAASVAEETEQALLDLSKQKWTWMAEKDVDALEGIFHEKRMFIHMGGTCDRAQELDRV